MLGTPWHTDNQVFMFGGFSPSQNYGGNIAQCFDLTKLLDGYVWTNGRDKLVHFSIWPSLKMRVTNFDQEQPPIFLQIGTKNVQET